MQFFNNEPKHSLMFISWFDKTCNAFRSIFMTWEHWSKK